jgi:hypothetical protein
MEGTPVKRLIVVACWLSIFGAVWSFGNQQAAKPLPGGITWNATQESEKQSYVVGFRHGYMTGMQDTLGAAILSDKPKSPLTPAQKKDMEEWAKEARKAGPVIFNQSALILAAAMSTFYNEGQNASVCWEKALMLSAASLAGNEPTTQELDTARKKGAQNGCT